MPISHRNSILRPVVAGLAAATLATLGACGGGSGGDDSGNNPPPAATTGTVGILFTDAPTDAFCQIRATVESIDLLGATPTNVFTGPETVDVLDMRNYSDFFAVDTAVPIGSYDKIRLTLSDLALVECDGAGVPEPESGWEHPNLPGNGKLDLNPRGAFEVIGGETMIIELDLDMEKSLHLHQTGNGKWQFRPVVFVTITPDDTQLVRVFGAVRDLDGMDFELCPIAPVSTMGGGMGGGMGMGGDMNGDDDSGQCLDVFVDADTGIFDEAGDPAGLGGLANGDLLTAIGFLGRHDDDDDGDSRMDDLRLDAAVLEFGPLDTFERIAGSVVSAPGNNDLFVFAPAAGGTAIDVLLQSGTRIFAVGSNEELTSAALQPATTGEVDGVFSDPPTSGEPLKSSLIVLDQDTTPGRIVLDGTIDTIPADDDADATTRRITVDAPGFTDQCVKTDAATRFLLITESPTTSETTEIVFADLAVGNSVDVYGSDDALNPECILADTVQKYVVAP